MINIRIQGDKEIIRGLHGVIQEIPRAASEMLDMAARETQVKMISEAPQATGILRESIGINAFNPTTRIIGPDAQYGLYQETRNYQPQGMPPLEKIKAWAEAKQFSSQAAFLIARKIAASGYPANPFVARTYAWVQGQISKHIEPFIAKISARYMAG